MSGSDRQASDEAALGHSTVGRATAEWEVRPSGSPVDDLLVTRLIALVGAERVSVPVRPGGPRCRVQIESTENAARVVTCLHAAGVAFRVVVGSPHTDPPEVLRSGGAVLSLERLTALLAVDEKSHLATIQSGARWGRAEFLLSRRGFTLGPIPPWLQGRTIAESIAENDRLRPSPAYGQLVDNLHAVAAVMPGGQVARTVSSPRRATGADLPSLMLGAGHRAGLVTEVQLPVWRRPAERPRLQVTLPDWARAVEVARGLLDADVRPTLWHAQGRGPITLQMELRSEMEARLARRFLSAAGLAFAAVADWLAARSPEPTPEATRSDGGPAPRPRVLAPSGVLPAVMALVPVPETWDPGAHWVPIPLEVPPGAEFRRALGAAGARLCDVADDFDGLAATLARNLAALP